MQQHKTYVDVEQNAARKQAPLAEITDHLAGIGRRCTEIVEMLGVGRGRHVGMIDNRWGIKPKRIVRIFFRQPYGLEVMGERLL